MEERASSLSTMLRVSTLYILFEARKMDETLMIRAWGREARGRRWGRA